MAQVPHLRVPFVVVNGSASVVEQDTLDEVVQCVQVLLGTPEGTREELPSYGIPDLAFATGLDLLGVRHALETWEPRAVSLLEEQIGHDDELLRQLVVTVQQRGGQ